MSVAELDPTDDFSVAGRIDDPISQAIRSTSMPMIVTDCGRPDNPIVFVNDAFLRLTGYGREEVIGRNCRFLQGQDTDPEAVRRVREAIADERDVNVEILNYRKDGRPFWNALYLSPVRTGGAVRYFFASQLDVTAKKETELKLLDAQAHLEQAVAERTRDLQEALEQKTVLLHEVDHRVKNNLQLISALMLLQARRAKDLAVRGALERMLERLNAISTVHRRLFQSDDAASFDLAEFLQDLAADLAGAVGRDDLQVELELAPVSVPANQAAPVALLVNEVMSNALRHAFPGERAGRLVVQLKPEDHVVQLTVRDDGVGRGESSPGFGSTIIELLGRQLKAEIARDDAPPGAAVHIRIPLQAESRR